MSLYVGLILALLGVGFYGGTLEGRAVQGREQAALAAKLAEQYQMELLDRAKKEATYESEIDQLKSNIDLYPSVAVRLCDSPVVPSAGRAGRPVSPAARLLPPQTVSNRSGRDVGQAAFKLADYADEIVAKCRSE